MQKEHLIILDDGTKIKYEDIHTHPRGKNWKINLNERENNVNDINIYIG